MLQKNSILDVYIFLVGFTFVYVWTGLHTTNSNQLFILNEKGKIP